MINVSNWYSHFEMHMIMVVQKMKKSVLTLFIQNLLATELI